MNNFQKACDMVEQGIGKYYPSACLGIGIGKTIYVEKAFGEVNLDTLFDIASISKIISTTMIALKYLEEGKIRLHDSISYFFDVPEDKKNITILQLLTHTSKIPSHDYLSTRVDSPENVVDAVLMQELLDQPENTPVYSCLGFILLGKILEKVGGTSIDKLAQEVVFNPLSLSNTTYAPKGDNIAQTEFDKESGKLLCGVVHDENARFLNGISGNAGVFSNLSDMMVFSQMLALYGEKLDGTKFLSKPTMNRAIMNYTNRPNQEFRGLGFNLAHSPANFLGDLTGARTFGHTGFTGTSISIDPDTGVFVVLLTNRVNPTRDNLGLVRMRSLLHNNIAVTASYLLEH